jgi:general secretion pathway protein H
MKVEREPRVTLRAGHAEPAGNAGADGQAGFTLLEIVCVLAIVVMLAAIALPAIPRATSLPRLEGYALETAALLNADHDAAQRHDQEIATQIDAPARMIRSGANGRILQYPSDVGVRALLASRCEERPAGATIRFLASGMSCGGVITLSRLGVGYQIRVNWLTGVADVVPVN